MAKSVQDRFCKMSVTNFVTRMPAGYDDRLPAETEENLSFHNYLNNIFPSKQMVCNIMADWQQIRSEVVH